MEIAPLDGRRSSYDQSPNSYKPYDFAEFILNKILAKSEKYSGVSEASINLLIYITHWAFLPSESVFTLLQLWTVSKLHIFKNIVLYCPIDPSEGIASLIYPTPVRNRSNFNPEALRNNLVQNLSPTNWKLPREE